MNPGVFWEVEVRWKGGLVDPRAKDLERQIESYSMRSGASSPPSGTSPRDEAESRAKDGNLRPPEPWRAAVAVSDLYFFRGEDASREALEKVSKSILADPVVQEFRVRALGETAAEAGAAGPSDAGPGCLHRATVLKKPGVMDPVEASLYQALGDLGLRKLSVRTGARYAFLPSGPESRRLGPSERKLLAEKVLSNPAIEVVHWEDDPPPVPFRQGTPYEFELREVPLAALSDEDLLRVSREGQLSLNLQEMQAVRDHFQRLGRAPTDAELETIAQTWSEHCCHKTLTGLIEHEVPEKGLKERIDNLLRSTIRKATEEINAPWCLSVFVDNAGVVAFDDEYAVTFKVETHNHPSAIEPYGGAGTGIGGVLRDTVGTGLGAKPIVNTDVFCFGPPDLPPQEVPSGALHPLRVLRGVVAGVRDYGNRMGIPTASGAVYFDSRYVGNPLVFCGSIGFIPRSALKKDVRPGDRIFVLGGRTGRDGIHGATFSSIELTHESETVSSGAVQIGNAITEKKLFDVILQARDRGLYRAITDCGAGGLSSAVGEMGAETGATLHLERVPLKYEGLSYWEIWISEAQERMVLAVPPEHAQELDRLAASEDVECTDLGEFTSTGRLRLLYEDHLVADLEMSFLHDGRPRWLRRSVYRPPSLPPPAWRGRAEVGRTLRAILSSPNVASKEWIIRQYDHEVQGGSVLKPLQGPLEGPGDAVAFAPRPGSSRGIVVGCGMNPLQGDLDPRRMALSAVDEAVRNVVSVGGDPARTAILDNFAWGNTDRPETLGSLVEAARGCYEAAVSFGTPFISGKDSLNNEYREGDRVISIPPTLLISALSVVEDVSRLVTMELKEAGSALIIVGETGEELGGSHFLRVLGLEGGIVPDVDLSMAPRIHRAVHGIIQRRLALSCHDLSEGGLAAAAAEMAFSGGIGAELRLADLPRKGPLEDEVLLFSESNSRYLLEVRPGNVPAVLRLLEGLPAAVVGETVTYSILRILARGGKVALVEDLEDLRKSWKGALDFK